MSTEKTDIYQRVTDQIIQAIEEGTDKYRMPWRTVSEFPMSPVNAVSRKPYRGINVLILWAVSLKYNHGSGVWATYKQWTDLGAQVRRGEKAARIVFWQIVEREKNGERDSETDARSRKFPIAREYHVFNQAQVDGYTEEAEPVWTREERIEHAEGFFDRLGVKVGAGMNCAFYDSFTDQVKIPRFGLFKDRLAYYSVLSHETVHWTGAKHRLNRDLCNPFQTKEYAFEELIAELGAAFLCASLNLPTDPRADHAPYIGSWLEALRNDKKAIFRAAAKAQEAVDWMKEKVEGRLEVA